MTPACRRRASLGWAIPEASKEELRGLLEVVDHNLRPEISVEQAKSPKQQINLGYLRSGQRGLVLLELKPADYKVGATKRQCGVRAHSGKVLVVETQYQ